MSKDKRYTEGPWERRAGLVFSPSDTSMVCEVSEPHGFNHVRHQPVDIGSEDWGKAMANAQLISLSPELAETLQELKEAVQSMLESISLPPEMFKRLNDDLGYEYEQARALLDRLEPSS